MRTTWSFVTCRIVCFKEKIVIALPVCAELTANLAREQSGSQAMEPDR